MAAAAQNAAVNAPVAQLCFGTGATELNLREVQKRVVDLIRVIDGLLADMQQRGAHWKGFLDKLAVINMAHHQIMVELRPLLRQYTVYPKFVDNPGIENALPEMLASRLLPDQVEQEAAWKAAMPGGLQQLATQPREAMDYANDQIGELQEMVGWLTNLQHFIKDAAVNPTPRELPVGLLDPKCPLRKDMDATTRQIVLAAAAAEKARVQAGTALLDAPPPPPAQQQPAAGQKRRRGDAAAAAATAPAVAVPVSEAETDGLIAKIMSGELWPRWDSGRL